MQGQRTRAVILIPTYNEKANVTRLVFEIAKLGLVDTDILFIDDNSPDGTAEEVARISQTHPWVRLLKRPEKQGLGKAYLAGFQWFLAHDYDVVIQMDADLSHEPQKLPEFLQKIKEYDAVFGTRYRNGVRVHNWSFKRLMLSKLSNEFIRHMLNIDATDITTAYKCFRREVIEAVKPETFKGRQNAFLIELVYATFEKKFKTTEVTFTFSERESGESKMNPDVAMESLGTVFRLAGRKCPKKLYKP